jgi:ATP-dependent DNA helicase 2 subunit 1
MSSYYGERSHNVPSWESFEAGDDDDIVDTSEVSFGRSCFVQSTG